jgi:RimJ/RimL family protein N-acetyltransferase
MGCAGFIKIIGVYKEQCITKKEFPGDFPKLETNRLVLRKLEESDAEALFENYSDEDIAKNFMDESLGDIQQTSQL